MHVSDSACDNQRSSNVSTEGLLELLDYKTGQKYKYLFYDVLKL